MLAIDSLEIYNEDSAYILTSFRFTATFPGGMADFISDSSNLTGRNERHIKYPEKEWICSIQ